MDHYSFPLKLGGGKIAKDELTWAKLFRSITIQYHEGSLGAFLARQVLLRDPLFTFILNSFRVVTVLLKPAEFNRVFWSGTRNPKKKPPKNLLQKEVFVKKHPGDFTSFYLTFFFLWKKLGKMDYLFMRI
jgi:hypothetical protein